jgi:hypothetical protein
MTQAKKSAATPVVKGKKVRSLPRPGCLASGVTDDAFVTVVRFFCAASA